VACEITSLPVFECFVSTVIRDKISCRGHLAFIIAKDDADHNMKDDANHYMKDDADHNMKDDAIIRNVSKYTTLLL